VSPLPGFPVACEAHDTYMRAGDRCPVCAVARPSVRHPSRAVLTVNGVSMTIAEACARYGLKRRTVDNRRAAGWSWRQALTTPVGGTRE